MNNGGRHHSPLPFKGENGGGCSAGWGSLPRSVLPAARKRVFLSTRTLLLALALAGLPGLALPAQADEPVSDVEIAASFRPPSYFRAGIAGILIRNRDFAFVVSSYDPPNWCAHLDPAVDRSLRQHQADWDAIIVKAARRAIPGEQLRRDYVLHAKADVMEANIKRFAIALGDAGAGPFLEARAGEILSSLQAEAATSQGSVSNADRQARFDKQVADKTFLCHLVPPEMMAQTGVSK